jgi:hypothetical protein
MTTMVWWFTPPKQWHWPGSLITCLLLGMLASAGMLFITFLILNLYLAIVSKIIFLSNRELRQTFSWSEFRQQHSQKLFVAFFILIVVLVSALKSRHEDRRNPSQSVPTNPGVLVP